MCHIGGNIWRIFIPQSFGGFPGALDTVVDVGSTAVDDTLPGAIGDDLMDVYDKSFARSFTVIDPMDPVAVVFWYIFNWLGTVVGRFNTTDDVASISIDDEKTVG